MYTKHVSRELPEKNILTVCMCMTYILSFQEKMLIFAVNSLKLFLTFTVDSVLYRCIVALLTDKSGFLTAVDRHLC